MNKKQLTTDAVMIGKWEDIKGIQAKNITHNDEDTEVLDGLLVYGYETKFGATNTNGEQYSKDAIDRFIQSYFVEKKLNMPLDIEHNDSPEWLAGRVIYIESNSVGFYFVGYVPRTYMHYDHVKNLLANKVLQGFSKCGWATDYEWIKEGNYELIKEIEIVRMSLVSTPANGVPFESVKEIQNSTRFTKVVEEETKPEEKKAAKTFADLFHK